MLRIDVAFKQTRQTLELDMAAGDQTLELTFDNFQRVDGAADYYDGAYDVTPLISVFKASDDPLTSAPAYALARPNTATIITPRISYYVIGKYK